MEYTRLRYLLRFLVFDFNPELPVEKIKDEVPDISSRGLSAVGHGHRVVGPYEAPFLLEPLDDVDGRSIP